MKNLAGTYRATGSNSYTCRELSGELTLLQTGAQLTGAYKFDENFDDGSPVAFSLPERDSDVTGEVSTKEPVRTFSDDNDFLSFSSAHSNELDHDAVLRLGDRTVFAFQLGNGNLLVLDQPGIKGLLLGMFRRIN
jgi:hypothetical protein